MNKFTVLATVMAAGLIAGNANASQIKIDASSIVPGASMSNAFNFLTISTFFPLSIFTPSVDNPANPAAGIQIGDSVKDVGSAFIGSLNPLRPSVAAGSGFGTLYDIKVTWDLVGTAFILPTSPTTFLGTFNSGKVVFDICTIVGDCTKALEIDITGSKLNDPSSGSVGIEVMGKVSFTEPGVFFNAAGQDFDGEMVFGIASSDIFGVQNAPTKAGCYVNNDVNGTLKAGATANDLCRTTNLRSVDVAFVPEPASLAILGLGLMGIGFSARRKSKASA